MPIDIRKYLKHTCQFQKVGASAFGDTTVTSTYTVSCFSYYGTSDKVLSKRQFTQRPGWTVVLPNSLSAIVASGDRIVDLRDNDNVQVITQSTIGEITIYRHHLYRTQFVQVQLELQ